MEKHILIIEDDSALAAGLCRALTKEGRIVKACANLQEADKMLAAGMPDLILLDVNLPDGNGYDYLVQLRRRSDVAVIFLTANDMETDIVAGLELGANDYITKPFSLAVLRARVNTQLRSCSPSDRKDICFERYRFNFERMEFAVGERLVELSKTEQKLLWMLVGHAGVTLSRDVLIDRVWSDGGEYVDENALSVVIKRLRDKLEAQEWIKTVYGIGYVWKAPEDEMDCDGYACVSGNDHSI